MTRRRREMMSQPKNGRVVKELQFPNGDQIHTTEGHKIVYESEFHGDHAENWFCVYKDGKEIQRHNAAYVDTVVWETEE
jgi:hypothetical protein